MVNRLHTKMTCFVVEKHRQTAEYCPFSLKPKVIRGDDGGLGPSLESVFEMIRDLRGNAQGELVPFQESFNSEWTNLDKVSEIIIAKKSCCTSDDVLSWHT